MAPPSGLGYWVEPRYGSNNIWTPKHAKSWLLGCFWKLWAIILHTLGTLIRNRTLSQTRLSRPDEGTTDLGLLAAKESSARGSRRKCSAPGPRGRKMLRPRSPCASPKSPNTVHVPAPPNYPLRDPKYQLIETLRPLI